MLQFTNVLRPSGLLLLFRELEHRTCLWAVGNVAMEGIQNARLITLISNVTALMDHG